jgi:hypothetical protein
MLLNTACVAVPGLLKVQPPRAMIVCKPELLDLTSVRSRKSDGDKPSIGAILKSPGVT